MKKRRILVRFDDICPTMDFVQFERALDVMRKHSVKPLLGVIPDCRDTELQIEPFHEDFWEYVKMLQKEGCTLAMHGYTHVYDSSCRGLVSGGLRSEFAGHTYEEQYERIKKGKEVLQRHGINTDIFFAPAHSYDRNTLKALAANGFRCMSDGKSSKPVYREGILCIPCRSSGCPRIRKSGYYTAVFHAHEWARAEKADGYEQLRSLCKAYEQDIAGFDEFNDRRGSHGVSGRMEEWIYVRFQRHIRPLLSKVKHNILRG